MPLDQFEREGCPIEIKVPGFLQTLWFVPRDSHRDALSRKGIGRGRIWTAHELIDLWRVPGVTKEHAKTLAGIKVEFEAEIVTIEPVVSQTPDPKDGTRA